MSAKLKVAVLGATGYSGLELTRLLLRHPLIEKPVLLRRPENQNPHPPQKTGKGGAPAGNGNSEINLADIFPALSGNGKYPLDPLSWPSLKQKGVELLFLATPHEVSRALVPEAVAQGIRVIDLSGAWRLKQAQHRAIYGFKDEDAVTAAELTEKAVYGLPELNSDQIPNAIVVANPGCYATTVILALAPILKAGWADRESSPIPSPESRVLAKSLRRVRILFPLRTISPRTACSRIAISERLPNSCGSAQAKSHSRRTCCQSRAEFCLPSTCV
jgi:N-acetyl-gamma-glutamyl-phosphate reductase